jgi:hypothetical protein
MKNEEQKLGPWRTKACRLTTGGIWMTAVTVDKEGLVRVLIEEANDAALMFYLARSNGPHLLKDLLECIHDSDHLSAADLEYNIQTLRKLKSQAYVCPVTRVCRRMMESTAVPVEAPLADPSTVSTSSLH